MLTPKQIKERILHRKAVADRKECMVCQAEFDAWAERLIRQGDRIALLAIALMLAALAFTAYQHVR